MFYSSFFLRESAQGVITCRSVEFWHLPFKAISENEASKHPYQLFPRSLSLIFPCQLWPVLVLPLTTKAVRELLGKRKYSSDLLVQAATTGLCEQNKSRSTNKPFFASEIVWLFKVTVTKGLGLPVRMWPTCSGRAASMLLSQWRTQADGTKLAHQNLVANLRWQDRIGSSKVCATHQAATKLLICCDQSNWSAVYQIYCVIGAQEVLWAGNTFKVFCTCKNKPKFYQVIEAAVKAGLPTAWPTAAIFTVPCRWSSMLVKLKVAWDQPWNSQS